MTLALEQILNGVQFGVALFLLAAGLTLIFGIMGVLNMAHADPAWTRMMIRRVREVCWRTQRHIALLMDVKGPEIRTGDLPAPVDLVAGQLVDLLPNPPGGGEDGVFSVGVNYPLIGRDVSTGTTVLVDSGLVRLEVIASSADRVRCKVIVPGRLTSRRPSMTTSGSCTGPMTGRRRMIWRPKIPKN